MGVQGMIETIVVVVGICILISGKIYRLKLLSRLKLYDTTDRG